MRFTPSSSSRATVVGRSFVMAASIPQPDVGGTTADDDLWDAGRHHQRPVLLALVRQHGAERERVFGGDPGVRNAADVAGTPLIPRARPAVAEQELPELDGGSPLAEVDERSVADGSANANVR